MNNLSTTKYDEENVSEDDEDYVPNLDESDDDDLDDDDIDEEYLDNLDDGSNKTYVFNQIKRIHKHITNLLGYFSNPSSKAKTQTSLQEEKEEEIIF